MVLQFVAQALHLRQPLIQLQAAAELGHQRAEPFRGGAQLFLPTRVERGLQPGGERLLRFLAGGRLGSQLLQSLHAPADLAGHRPEHPQRARREGRQATFGQPQSIAMGFPFIFVGGDLALQLQHPVFQGTDPILLLGQGLDARGVAEHGGVRFFGLGLAAQALELVLQFVPLPLPLLDCRVDPVQSREVGLGERVDLAERRELLLDHAALFQPGPDRLPNLDDPQLSRELPAFFFQLGGLAIEHDARRCLGRRSA